MLELGPILPLNIFKLCKFLLIFFSVGDDFDEVEEDGDLEDIDQQEVQIHRIS